MGMGAGNPAARSLAGLAWLNVDCLPSRTIFIHHLVWIGDSFSPRMGPSIVEPACWYAQEEWSVQR